MPDPLPAANAPQAGGANNNSNPAGNNQNPAPQAGANQTPAQNPGTNQPQPFIMNQEQFDQRWAEKMGNIEKDLGLQPGGMKDFIATQKAKQKPASQGEKLSGSELRLAKMEALMEKGVPSKNIPAVLEAFNIKGSTREEIASSIQALIEAKLLSIEQAPDPKAGNGQQQNQTPVAAQGAGNNGVNTPPAKKVWKESEVKSTLRDPSRVDPKVLEEINLARKEGRITYGV